MSDAGTGRALAARLDAARRATVEGARQLQREVFLPEPFLAREQKRAGDAPLLQHPAQNLLRALIPDESVKHKSSLKSGV
jgi:hypothetical protein